MLITTLILHFSCVTTIERFISDTQDDFNTMKYI